MPIFEYNGNKVNVNEDQVNEFAKYHPDAITRIERDGKVYGVRPGDMDAFNARFTNNQEGEQASQIYYQPQATENVANKDTGSFLGDAYERIKAGAMDFLSKNQELLGKAAGTYNDAVNFSKGIKTNTASNNPMLDWSEANKRKAEELREASDRYNGKGFFDLAKNGEWGKAAGSAMLSGFESLPQSAAIMAATPFGLGGAMLADMGITSAMDRYKQLSNPSDGTPEWQKEQFKNMPEWKKIVDAGLYGVAEAGSEYLGNAATYRMIANAFKFGGKQAALDTAKKGFIDTMGKFMDKTWFISPAVVEGLEEVGNTYAQYATDKALGLDWTKGGDNEAGAVFKQAVDAFAGGFAGGTQFTAMAVPGHIKQWNDIRKVTNAYNNASKGIEGIFNEQEKAQFDETIHRFQRNGNMNDINMFLFNVYYAKELDQKNRNALLRYAKASISYNNYVSYVNDRINDEVKRRMEDIDSNINEDMGTVMQAVVNGDTENPVFVTKGKLYSGGLDDNMNPTIDYDKSDDVIYYRDKDGKIQQCDVKNVSYIENEKTRANLYAEIMDEVRGQVISEEENDINFAPGDEVVLPDGNTGTIQSKMEDGSYTVVSNGMTNQYTADQLVKPNEQAESEPEITSEERAATRADYPTKNGKIDFDNINDPQMFHDGLLMEFGDDAESSVDEFIANLDKELKNAGNMKDPIKKRRKIAEINQKLDFFNQVKSQFQPKENTTATVESAEAPVEQAMGDITEQPVETNDVQPEQSVAKTENSSSEKPVSATPYEDRPVDDTIYDLLDGQMDIDEVNQFVEANKKASDKALKEIEGKKPQVGTDRAEYLRQKSVWQALMDDARRKSDYWTEVKNGLDKGNITEAEQNTLNAYDKQVPLNAHELAARALANGSIKLLREDYQRETGGGNAEANKMFGIFASEQKGGVGIERAGEILTQMDHEAGTNFLDPDYPNAARDVIIDVLSQVRTRGDLINYIRDQRQAQQRREEEAAYNDFAKYTTEAYGMTPEEYQAYEDDFMRNVSSFNAEVSSEVDGMIYDGIKQEIDDYNEVEQQLNNNDYGENEQGGVSEEGYGGGEILYGQPSVPFETGDRAVEGAGQAVTDGDVQDETPQGEAGGAQEERITQQPDENTGVKDSQKIAESEQEVDVNATDAQKEAGNYKKGHLKLKGFDITIENPAGSVRSGVDRNGSRWENRMNNTYGYFKGTQGVDGDHIDVYLSNDMDNWSGDNVYVIDQYNPDGSFDEHKVMFGFDNKDEALSNFLANYSQGWGDSRKLDVTPISMDGFKKWVDSSHRKTKPFASYKAVKALTEEVDQKRTNIREDGTLIDESGNPLTLYHGTPDASLSIDRLEAGHARLGEDEPARFNGDGISFTPNESVALDYSDGGKGKVLKANIVLRNPWYTVGNANMSNDEARSFTDRLKREGYDGIINYSSQPMREIGALPAEVIVFDRSSLRPVEDAAKEPAVESSEPITGTERSPYAITPYKYTTQKGKVLDMRLVSFDAPLTDEQKKIANKIAKEDKGWFDRKSSGYLMRSEDSAMRLAEAVVKANNPDISKEDYNKDNQQDKNASDSRDNLIPDNSKAKSEETPTGNSKYSDDAYDEWTNGIKYEDAKFPAGILDENKVEKKQKAGNKTDGVSVKVAFNGNDLHVQIKTLHKSNDKEIVFKDATKYGASDITYVIDRGIGTTNDGARLAGDAILELYGKRKLRRGSSFYRPITSPFIDEDAKPNNSPKSPIVEDGTTFKNNIAGGNAVARVVGSTIENGERKYLVRYATGLEEMDAKLLAGEETLPEDELRQRIEDGRFGTMDSQESKEKNEKPKERPKEKIEDVGEKIGGARKDIIRATADRIDINGETFSKIFPKFDFKKLIQSGLDPKLASGLKFIYDHSKESFKSKKRSRGEIAALNETRFIANYAKGYLLGDTSVDYSDKGWVFTTYGKELYQFNTELYNKLHEVLGDDMFDIDLGKYFIDVVPDSDGSKGKSSAVFYRDGKPIDVKYIVKVGDTKLFTKDEHDDAVKLFLDKVKSSVNYKKANPYKLLVYYFPRKKGSYYIGTKIGGKVVALTPEGNGYNYSYIDEHRAELQAAAERMASEMKDNAKSGENKKWKPEMNLGNMRDRVGMDYREGRSVSAKELMDKFGFRGIEFGNYVTQKERQQYLNECYDAFLDMADILGISPKAISIDGKLALAVGARGTGKAIAHYEPSKHVINLTKVKSAGTLAHEWWHAMDFHFGRKSSPAPSTDYKYDEDTRVEVRKSIESLMGKIQDSDYYKRSRLLDNRIGGKDYYSTNTELAARAFQDYITKRLIDKGQINDFLSHYTLAGDWNGEMETYPYPIESEADWIRASFDNLFSIIEEKEVDGNTVLYQKANIARRVSEDEANLRDALVDRLRQSGIDVIDNAEEGQKVLEEANAPARMQAKRRLLDTAPLIQEEGSSADISSSDGAKILRNLDDLASLLENVSSWRKSILSDIANALGAKSKGSGSRYATFKTKKGVDVTIRLGSHKANTASFDNNNEANGISIVISNRANNGIKNYGNAHLVEFFYPEIALRRADGKPLAEIVRSIKQALYSGEFNDPTGIAERQEVNAGTRFFRTPSGEAYGYTVNGKIYIDPRIATSETPIHEYAHLWASALRSSNQEEWKNVVDLMKGTPVWEEVRRSYPELTTDDEIADEVLAQYSGRRGAEKLREAMKKASETKGGLIEKANAIAAIQNVKDALNRFWRKVADFFGVHFTTAEEVADKVLSDLLNGVNPTALATKKRQLDKINKENPMLDDYHTGIRSIDDILTFREAVEQARREGNEGGWETLSAYPDVSNETLERAIESGKITVYSSHPITDGVFITPSRMQAEEYAGGGRVYQKEVNVDDVAWITTDEGQLAKVKGDKLPLRLQKDQEIDEIISRAKAEGTYMKAPNGKPSNLTPRQWAQVRTKAFKDWFGDWEKSARIEKLRNSDSVSIKGDEIEITDDYKQNKRNALEYGKRLQGNYLNADTGISVQLQRGRKNGGINEVLQHNYKDVPHILSVAAIPQIIKKSIYISSEPNNDTVKNPDVVEYQHFVCGLKIGNEDYTVHSLIAVDRSGDRYYDHNLTNVEKTKLLDRINSQAGFVQGFDTTSGTEPTTFDGYKGKKLAKLLQIDSSKVVDENGEPMVVYHGTDKDIASFEMNDGSMGRGVYFTSNWNEAAEYAMDKQGVTDIDEVDESKIYECFVNVRDDSQITHSRFSGEDIEVLVTDPAQIKSATDNIGAFDGTNPDIRYREGEQNSPDTNRQRMRDEAVNMGNYLGVEVRIVEDGSELPGKRGKAKGFFDRADNSVTVVIGNHKSIGDIQATILHEIVGHYGLRQMFGERFDDMMDTVYRTLDKATRGKIADVALRLYRGDVRVATEEYLASIAERGVERPGVWNRIKSAIRSFFRSMGIDLRMSDEDIAYLLWKSKNRLMDGDSVPTIIDKVAKDQEMREGLLYRDGLGFGSLLHTPKKDRKGLSDIAHDIMGKIRNGNPFTHENFIRLQEGYQDRLIRLKEFQDKVAKETGHDVKDFEDMYTFENQAHSRAQQDIEDFLRDIMKPVWKLHDEIVRAINKPAGEAMRDIETYMMIKHGLERNAEMRKREIDALRKSGANPSQDDIDKINAKDFSGLTAISEEITGNPGMDEKACEKYAKDFESKHDTDKLWKAINKATGSTLDKLLETGQITKELYSQIKGMYKYYIPLKEWDGVRATDMYDYVEPDQDIVSNPLKQAKGRKTRAGNVLANIASDYESATMLGYKNLCKLRLLNLARNSGTSELSVSEQWYTKGYDANGNEIWEPASATGFTEDAAHNAQVIQDFNDNMRALQKSGDALLHKDVLRLGVPVKKWQEKQHTVRVKEAGREILIYFNGDPRVAQAINGQNNVKLDNAILRVANRLRKWMMLNYTARNINFILRNFARDFFYVNTMNFVKYGAAFEAKYIANFPKAFAEICAVEFKGRKVPEYESFRKNGGMTGYVEVMGYDRYKNEIERIVKKSEGRNLKVGDFFHAIGSYIERFNSVIENCSRYTVYKTAKQTGMSELKAIEAAKEASVNFNRRGSGQMGAVWAQNAYFFFNASMQGTENFVSAANKNRARAAMALGFWVAFGYTMRMIGAALSGDDDDSYDNLPDYVRQNNIVLYVPGTGNKYIMLPLPVELRAIFGLGDMLGQASLGQYKGRDFAGDLALKLTDLLPKSVEFPDRKRNDDESVVESVAKNLSPDAIRPLLDAYWFNENYFGKRVTGRNAYNRHVPEWQKVSYGTSKTIINASRMMNELTGGDYATKGWSDSMLTNPSALEYLFEQYLGGVGKVLTQSYKSVEGVVNGDLAMRNVPVLSGLTYSTENMIPRNYTNERYRSYIDEYEETASRMRKYKEGMMEGENLSDEFNGFTNSDAFRRYMLIGMFKKQIDGLYDMAKTVGSDSEEAKNLNRYARELKGQMINEIDKLDKNEK